MTARFLRPEENPESRRRQKQRSAPLRVGRFAGISILAFGCAGPLPAKSLTTTATPVTAATSSTLETGDTGDALPILPPCVIEPAVLGPTDGTWPTGITASATILGMWDESHEFQLGLGHTIGLLPPHGTDRGQLILYNLYGSHAFGLPDTLILDACLPRGEHPVLDLWDGFSSYDYGTDRAVSAGDVDDDGHLDAWFGNLLYYGPLLGRVHHLAAPDAELPVDQGGVTDAGFDVDGDGHEDALTTMRYRLGRLVYGPDFVREVALGEGYCDYDVGSAVFYENGLGAGRHVAGIGAASGWNGLAGCRPVTNFYDITGSLAAVLPDAAAVVGETDMIEGWDSVGDLNGDGVGDGVYTGPVGGLASRGRAFLGPITGEPHLLPDAFAPVNGYPMYGVGDMNGDGVEEIVGRVESLVEGQGGEALIFSPYPPVVDFTQALFLSEAFPYGSSAGHGDLDGDGRSDLYIDEADIPNGGRIRIWYGADLAALEERRVAALEQR